jgi:geranylgeranyl reductase family protein
MGSKFDVIISGCGPSGSLLGYLLSSEGIKTLIIEKKNFPRYKICAGGLQHRVLTLIPFDVSSVIEKSLKRIFFSFRGKDSFLREYDSYLIHTVDRRKFDFFMAEIARENGCTISFGENVKDYEQETKYLTVFTDRGNYRSSILVGADGIRGTVHKNIVSGHKIKKILGYEVERLYSSNDKKKYGNTAGLDFGCVKMGYTWAFPKKDKISYGIGGPENMALSMKRYFTRFLYSNNGSCIKDKIMAQCIPIRSKDTPLCKERILTIGDAACLGDGFTGEGLFNAFRSSHLALSSIKKALASADYSFNDYSEAVQQEIYSDIKISLIFSRIFFAYPMFFYKLLKSNDKFFNLCCQVLRGEKRYSHISGKLNLFSK